MLGKSVQPTAANEHALVLRPSMSLVRCLVEIVTWCVCWIPRADTAAVWPEVGLLDALLRGTTSGTTAGSRVLQTVQ